MASLWRDRNDRPRERGANARKVSVSASILSRMAKGRYQRRRTESLDAELRAAAERTRNVRLPLPEPLLNAADPDPPVRPEPPVRPVQQASGSASEGDQPQPTAYEAMVIRCNAEFRRWRAPGFVPARVMTDRQWAEVEPLLVHLRRTYPTAQWESPGDSSTRRPVLYAITTGEQHNWGSFLKSTTKFDVLIEVFADGGARCTGWPRHKRKTTSNTGLTEHLRVANIGGVSWDHELIIIERDFPTFRIRAPHGSPAAATIDALNLDAARGTGPRLDPWGGMQPENKPKVMAYQEPEPTNEYTRKAMGLPRLAPLPSRTDQPRPAPRMVRDAAEAEALAADWVRWLGWTDASITQPGADGGVDVLGRAEGGVAAQVKFEAVKTGRPVLQALYGAGHGLGVKHWVFFSSAGYTTQAVAWADHVGMLLFRFALDGTIEPINSDARGRFGRA